MAAVTSIGDGELMWRDLVSVVRCSGMFGMVRGRGGCRSHGAIVAGIGI